jgi:hypothetical protein
MQDFSKPQTAVNAVASNEPVDGSLAQQMHGLVSEASERVTFHRVELERWGRVGRAASLAINELQSATPVAQQAPDGFLDHDQADQPQQGPAKW